MPAFLRGRFVNVSQTEDLDPKEVADIFQSTAGLSQVHLHRPKVERLAAELSNDNRALRKRRWCAHRVSLVGLVVLLVIGWRVTDDLARGAAYPDEGWLYWTHRLAFVAFLLGWVEIASLALTRTKNALVVIIVGGFVVVGLVYGVLWLDIQSVPRWVDVLYFSIGVNLLLAGALAGLYLGLLLAFLFWIEFLFWRGQPKRARAAVVVSLTHAIPLLTSKRAGAIDRQAKESLYAALSGAAVMLRKYLPQAIGAPNIAVQNTYQDRARSAGNQLQSDAGKVLARGSKGWSDITARCRSILEAAVSEDWSLLPQAGEKALSAWTAVPWFTIIVGTPLLWLGLEALPNRFPDVEDTLRGVVGGLVSAWVLGWWSRR